jgi:ribosomal protein S18 acetylase RimI-like enzyme
MNNEMTHEVLTYQLEISERSKFLPKENYNQIIEIRPVKTGHFINYVLFLGVGLPHRWFKRLLWDQKKWDTYLKDEKYKFFLGFYNNEIIGFFELYEHPDSAEIKYFGLLPEFIGIGIGGSFLSHAINEAFHLNKEKVWLHTCVFDHETALKNYLARGFEITKEYYVTDKVFTKERFMNLISDFFENHYHKNKQNK